MEESMVFDIFAECVRAMGDGELIESVSAKDKEFHFQNWFQKRLDNLNIFFDGVGRNTYPDFPLVNYVEGYEIKGLAWPGRERDYDSNSQVPTGYHNGRRIFYVFGRYPAELSQYSIVGSSSKKYPVVDLVVCHGDFLNADHKYKHKNKNIKGFGTYGDIMIRDRKMYVAPTPFALAEGTTGLATLILPDTMSVDEQRFRIVGELKRVESDNIIVSYRFDLQKNEIFSETIPNPNRGTEHKFIAYRLKTQTSKRVSLIERIPETLSLFDEKLEDD